MASVVYNEFKLRSAVAYMSGKDIRARLVMTNTTCDTQNDGIAKLSDFTTIDPCDATGYADVALIGEATSKDDAGDRGEIDANDVSFAGLGGGAPRGYQGVLLYEFVDGTNANDIPVAFIEFSNQPLSSGATQVDIPWDAEGIIQYT